MKNQDFLKAIEVLSNSHSVEIVINHVKPGGNVGNVCQKDSHTLHIKNCCAAAISELNQLGFSLHMRDGMLDVCKY